MMRYRNRFRYERKQSLHPLALVAIILAASVVLTLIVGNLLKNRLDDDTYKKLIGKDTNGQNDSEPPEISAPTLRALPYRFGSGVSKLQNAETETYPEAVSLLLNQSTKELCYTSDVAVYQGHPSSGAKLSGEMEELEKTGAVLSGVFYPTAPTLSTTDLRFAGAVEEIALLHEFCNLGGDEILLCGIPLDEDGVTASLAYLRQVKATLGDTPVGVAIPYSVASSQNGWELIDLIWETGCFVALDFGELGDNPSADRLLDANFYLVSYGMRLLLRSTQTELINASETALSNYQILF